MSSDLGGCNISVLKDFDDLLEVIEEKIKTLQRIKKGLMEVYFTKGVFEHKEFKDTEIGRIPKNWKVKKLGEVADFKNGLNFSKEEKVFSQGTLMADVFNMYTQKIYLEPKNFYRVNKHVKKEFLLSKGDILLVRSSLKREVLLGRHYLMGMKNQ